MTTRLLARRDVDFLLYEWLDVESLTTRERYAEHSRETFAAALDTYAAIAAEKFAPHNRKNDEHEPHFDGERVELNPEVGEAIRAFAQAGLIAAAHDAEMGGMQLPHVVERAGMAHVFAANIGTAAYPFLTIANASLLRTYAAPAIVEDYVRPMLEGRYLGTMCLSEPNAGSSLADITTRAVRQSDGRYRLFGNKMWISGGEHEISENIVHLVLAKIPEADGRLPAGVKGISLFVVPKYLVADGGRRGERNDIVLAGLNHKMGYRGTTNCLLNFGEGRFRPEGAPGALGVLVGEAGQGLAYMFHMMNEARIGVGVGAAALGYCGYLHAVDYARSRRQGRPSGQRDPNRPPALIIEHADVRRMLLAQKAYVEGALALVLYSARLLDEQHTAEPDARLAAERLLDLLTPVTKSWPSQWCVAANDLAIQVHGGYGYTRDFPVEQLYRDNRLNPIHEGTNGIQALDLLGRKVRQHEGAALAELSRRVAATVSRARSSGLESFAQALERNWRLLEHVTNALQREDDANVRLANASAYLEAFGHVVIAWIWLEQALIAVQALTHARTEDDINFYSGKREACRYFFQWELPKVPVWLALLDPIERTCLDMPAGWF
jgi:alkylation response protein AidB-like acyl-CoA dehydrogenase